MEEEFKHTWGSKVFAEVQEPYALYEQQRKEKTRENNDLARAERKASYRSKGSSTPKRVAAGGAGGAV